MKRVFTRITAAALVLMMLGVCAALAGSGFSAGDEAGQKRSDSSPAMQVRAINIQDDTTIIKLPRDEYEYTGSQIKPPVEYVFVLGIELQENVDFTVSYGLNVEEGEGTVILHGKGNYTGTAKATFQIFKVREKINAKIKDGVLSWTAYPEATEYWYGIGEGFFKAEGMSVDLKSKVDEMIVLGTIPSASTYEITLEAYQNETKLQTWKGVFVYKSGEKITISNAQVRNVPESVKYTGSPITPEPEVDVNGITLVKGTDYTVDYQDNVNVGIASVIITGIGNYKDSVTVTFEIVPDGAPPTSEPPIGSEPSPSPVPEAVSLSECRIEDIGDQIYTGRAVTPAVTVTYQGTALIPDTDYTLSYRNNTEIGTAEAVLSGINGYTGTVSKSFRINPTAVKLKSLKAGKQSLTVKWKAWNGINGYEIEYGLKKNFNGAKKITVKKAQTTSYEIKKLKSKKTYYVRIRAYKKVKGKKYYSDWSKVLSKKTK